MSNMNYLLEYCSECPELYNKVSNKIWAEFGIQSAEVTLLCTYLVKEFIDNEHRKGNKG